MLETLTIIYLIYTFVALYFLCLFGITFFQNKDQMFYVPPINKRYTVSVLIPAYNEQNSIRGTVETVLKSDYPELKEVIILNDGSTDKTLEIARDLERKYTNVRVLDKENSGKANSLNMALQIARGDLIAVVDADSYPDAHAIKSLVGFFSDERVGAATTRVLVRNRDTFLGKMQAIEYKVIAFTRMLLGFLDSIYVTPGPLALYRKTALIKIGGFDPRNMTEDIEITWRMLYNKYKVKMSFVAKSTTVAPTKLKAWIKQRIRWNIGGYQTILKYKKNFFRKGTLGLFILPFFSISLLLGVVGLGILVYRTTRRFLVSYLSTKYSLEAQTAILRLQEINFNASVLNFLGLVLFVLGLWFVFYALKYINDNIKERDGFLSVIFYSIVYIMLRPIVLIWSLGKFISGKYSWR